MIDCVECGGGEGQVATVGDGDPKSPGQVIGNGALSRNPQSADWQVD